MINKTFEAYKIKREIERSGNKFEFYRPSVNDFGEPGELTKYGELKGIYHEQNSYVQLNSGDTTQIKTKKMPMILCLYEEAKNLNLNLGDILILNNKKLKVISLVNIQEWNIIGDLSLEEIASDVFQS